MDCELLRAILFPACTYEELAEQYLDRDWVLWPGCMRKTMTPEYLKSLSCLTRRAVLKLLPTRGFVLQENGNWTLTAKHWNDCRPPNCTCWRKQCGYWPDEWP